MVRNSLLACPPQLSIPLILTALAGCQGTSTAQSKSASPASIGDADTASRTVAPNDDIVLRVYGMSCPLCATNVDKQLLKIKGVESVDVDLGSGEVVVHVAGEHPPSYESLAHAVRESGFTLIGEEQP